MKTHSRIIIFFLLVAVVFSACSTLGNQQNTHSDSSIISKRILFCGDSITRGVIGSSYIKLLSQRYPEYELINLGLNGDTVSGIMNRTINHLKKNQSYDLIVISAGHNDIVLPAFTEKNILYGFIAVQKSWQGSIPSRNYLEFTTTYDNFINSIREITPTPIVIATLSCLNEEMSASTNRKRLIYNQGIRNLAADKNISLADVGLKFDEQLSNYECNDYFMDNLFDSFFFARAKSRTASDAEELSRERSLHLTIDGIHLNPHGSQIYTEILSPFLENLK